MLESDQSGKLDASRTAVYSARERHSSSRYNTLGYPQRAIRTKEYLLIRNFRPERWPAGPSRKFSRATFDASGKLLNSQLGPEGAAYHDIDACPSLTLLVKQPELKRFLDLAVAKRPALELFDIKKDPGCMKNLADYPSFDAKRDELENQLLTYLRSTGDRRAIDGGDVWETYPRVSSMRWYPKPIWTKTTRAPDQPWHNVRKPK